MKKITGIVLIIAAIVSSCCDCENNKENNTANETPTKSLINNLIPSKIIVNQKFSFEPLAGDSGNLGGFDKDKFIKDIIEKAKTNEITVYNFEGINTEVDTPMDLTTLKAFIGIKTDTVELIEDGTGKRDTAIAENLPPYETFNNIFFAESWFYNDSDFIMTKEVEGYGIVQDFYRESDVNKENMLQRVSFYLDFDNKNQKINSKDVKDKTLIAENIKYLCNPNENEAWSKNFDKSMFVKMLFEKALSGEIKAFDFYDNTELSINEVKEIIQDYDGYYFVDDIEDFVFIEDWYLDTKTYKIIKKVKGIAPVRVFYRPDDENMNDPQKQILFILWFNSN
ncbi:MAG: hypothetical protein Kow0068_02160 [Marinilabiliales bacterium]